MANPSCPEAAFTAMASRMSEANSRLATRLEPFLGAFERSVDFLTIIAAVYCSYPLYRTLGVGYQPQYPASGVLASAAGLALLFVVLLERHGGYRRYRSLLGVRETEQVLRVTAECSLLALLVAYFAAIHVSRILVLITVTAIPAFLTLQKWEMYRAISTLRSKGHGTHNAVIFGAGAMGRRIYSALARSPKFGLDPVALVDEDPAKSGIEVFEASYQRKRAARVLAGTPTAELLRQWDASTLVIAEPSLSRDAMIRIITQLSAAGVNTYFVPQDLSGPGQWIEYDELDGMLLAHVAKERPRLAYELTKRLLDLLVAALMLIISAPAFVAIAALVKLTSPGPALFRQERVGKNGRSFSMYKFRTMFRDAPRYAYSPKVGEDPRITPVGRLLRRASLDELPQLLNVLRGDMSLVGPRPEMPFIVEQYSPLHRQRLAVKPGITGLWQLSADRAFLIHENIEYDLYYLTNNPRFLWDIALQFAGLRRFELN
jgi:exopolysaccharide biosynthesis polyprenyl glycosylphosphotransferase